MQKYELTDEFEVVQTRTEQYKLYQIKALVDIPVMGVKAGDLGGHIEEESCLTQSGACWVFEGSKVRKGSKVRMDGQVMGKSLVKGRSVVSGKAVVKDSKLYAETIVQNNAIIQKSSLDGKSKVSGKSMVTESELMNVQVKDGRILKSELLSRRVLVFEKNTQVTNSILKISGDEVCVNYPLVMLDVIGRNVKNFALFETTNLSHFRLMDYSSLVTGNWLAQGSGFSEIKGNNNDDGLIFLDKGELEMRDSCVSGQGKLKGTILLEQSSVLDFINIVNEMEYPLHLQDMFVCECVSFHKYQVKDRSIFKGMNLYGDTIIEA